MVSIRIVILMAIYCFFLIKCHVADDRNTFKDKQEDTRWKTKNQQIHGKETNFTKMFEITHANSSHSNESYSNYNDEDAEYYYYDEEEDDDEGEYEEENGGHDETDNEYYEEEEEEEGGERTCQKGCQCEDNSLLCNEFNIFRRFKTFSYAPRVKNM